jgi:hypothetical protein
VLKFIDGETQSILGLKKPCLERAAAGHSRAEKKAKRKERKERVFFLSFMNLYIEF